MFLGRLDPPLPPSWCINRIQTCSNSWRRPGEDKQRACACSRLVHVSTIVSRACSQAGVSRASSQRHAACEPREAVLPYAWMSIKLGPGQDAMLGRTIGDEGKVGRKMDLMRGATLSLAAKPLPTPPPHRAPDRARYCATLPPPVRSAQFAPRSRRKCALSANTAHTRAGTTQRAQVRCTAM